MRKRTWLIVVLVLIISAAVITYLRRGRQNANRSIVIAQSGDFFLYAPLYVAVDAKIFEKQHLNVSIVSTGGDEKTWAAVVSGSAKFGVSDPTFVAISEEHGQPGRVVFDIVNGVPFWGISLNQSMPAITAPRDLAGHTVATFPAPSTAYTLQEKMFQDAGLKPNIRQGAFGTLYAMLRSGQADIALELEPNVSQAVRGGAKIVYSMRDMYGPFAITGLTSTPENLRNDPQLVRDVVCSLQLSLDYIHKNPEEALHLLSHRFPEISTDVAKAALDRVLREDIVPSDGVITAEAWDKAIALRRQVGDVQTPKPMQSYVDTTYAEWAKSSCRER